MQNQSARQLIGLLVESLTKELARLIVEEGKRQNCEPRNVPIKEAAKMSGMPMSFLKHATEKKPSEDGFLPHSLLPDPHNPYTSNRRKVFIRTDDLWEWMRQFRRG
jgi:hypothetical protein